MQFDSRFQRPAYFPESAFYEIFDKRFCHVDVKTNIDPEYGNYSSCFISPNLVVDVLEHERTHLFGTIGCTKSENKLRRIRNKTNLSHSQLVLDSNSILEDYTYFILDYTTGIISVINTKGAPDIKSLKILFSIYPEMDPVIFPIKNKDVHKALDKIVDVEGVTLQFAVPPAELLGTDGYGASMEIINQFKQDGFERCELRFRLDSKNPLRKRPKEIIRHVKDTYELVRESGTTNAFKLEKLGVIATPEEERQQLINVLELNFTKGVNLRIDENFSENSIKDELMLVYNRLKEELLKNVELHLPR